MSWPKARLFLSAFGELGNSLGDAFRPAAAATPTVAAVGASVLSSLPKLIRESTDLSELLVDGCVVEIEEGKIKRDDLCASDFLRLLDASLEVTLNEDVIKLGNAVAGRVRGVMAPANPPTSCSPSGSTP